MQCFPENGGLLPPRGPPWEQLAEVGPPASFRLCNPPSCLLHPEAGLATLPDVTDTSPAPTQLGRG